MDFQAVAEVVDTMAEGAEVVQGDYRAQVETDRAQHRLYFTLTTCLAQAEAVGVAEPLIQLAQVVTAVATAELDNRT